jgi:nicotine blue oxidoreductase
VILAAGRGTRMGGPKALMEVEGRPWWRTQQERLGGLPCVWVAAPEVAAQLRGRRGSIVAGDPDAPMFESIRAGLRGGLDPGVGGAFILPVDVPAPLSGTIRMLAAAAGSGVAVPSYQGRRGHPAALSRSWVQRVLLPAPPGSRLDHLIGTEAVEVPVADPSVTVNLNTRADVARWLNDRDPRP